MEDLSGTNQLFVVDRAHAIVDSITSHIRHKIPVSELQESVDYVRGILKNVYKEGREEGRKKVLSTVFIHGRVSFENDKGELIGDWIFKNDSIQLLADRKKKSKRKDK